MICVVCGFGPMGPFEYCAITYTLERFGTDVLCDDCFHWACREIDA